MRAEDHASFTAWARGRQLSLVRVATLITGDPHRAEDLVQDALTKVALRWGTLQHTHPEAYARQIIVRDSISMWRRRRREVVTDLSAHDVAVVDGARSVERRLLLETALASLTPKQRVVVVLRYYEDLTERAAAEVLGVSIGTVKSQTHLALRRMREAVPELADLLSEELR